MSDGVTQHRCGRTSQAPPGWRKVGSGSHLFVREQVNAGYSAGGSARVRAVRQPVVAKIADSSALDDTPAKAAELLDELSSQDADTRQDALHTWAGELMLPAESLAAIGAVPDTAGVIADRLPAWARSAATPTPPGPDGLPGKPWCPLVFPSYDGQGRVIGFSVRLPRPATNPEGKPVDKLNVPGLKAGLFLPADVSRANYERFVAASTIYVVEGVSDTAALHALGLAAVGRPSNTGGAEHLAELLRLYRDRVIILGENDQKAGRDDAPEAERWPGRYGARTVAEKLAAAWSVPVRWAMPPADAKDVRDWAIGQGLDPTDEPSRWHAAGEQLAEGLNIETAEPADGEPWPELEPLDEPADDGGQDAAPFPLDALPQPVRQIVEQVAGFADVDVCMPAVTALTVAAGAIGNRVAVLAKGGHVEPICLWSAIVGKSGTGKTPAMKPLIDALYQCDAEDRRRNAAADAEYGAAKEQHDAAAKAHKKDPTQPDPGPAPKKPRHARSMVSDTSMEKLASVLADNPFGVLQHREELAGWLGSFDRYAASGGGDEPAWLALHDGRPITVDRKIAQSAYVKRGLVSVLGGIQPGIIRRRFGQAQRDSGLLGRFLLAWPRDHVPNYSDSPLNPDLLSAWVRIVAGLRDIVPGDPDEDGDPTPRLLPLGDDDGARARYIEWVNGRAGAIKSSTTEDLRAYRSKLNNACLRIAGVIECLARVANMDQPKYVGRKSLESAIAITDWFSAEGDRLYGALAGDGDQELATLAKRVWAWAQGWTAKRDTAVFAHRDIQRAQLGGLALRERRDAVLEYLQTKGFIRPAKTTAGKVTAWECRPDARTR